MIHETENYDRFHLLKNNRPVKLWTPEAKRLIESMLEHGWLDQCPMMVMESRGKLFVKDGQHRLAIAKEYGITPVKYSINNNKKVDVVNLNNTSRPWSIDDHIHRGVADGIPDYEILQRFSKKYGIPPAQAAVLLGGQHKDIKGGNFTVRTPKHAESVGETYAQCVLISPEMKSNKFVSAIHSFMKVDYFSPHELIRQVAKYRHLIRRAANIQDAREVLDRIYNHKRRNKRPIAFDASNVNEKMAA